jgi:hypothetical protein
MPTPFIIAFLCLFCSSCSFAQNKKAPNSQHIGLIGESQKVKILMIGDSLTVGPFGARMQDWLIQRHGEHNVAIYASCGSSPEHWLAANPVFTSKCGYRETRPNKKIYESRDGGDPTRVRPAPKIEYLLALHRPDIIIVQMGTNHYDVLEKNGDNAIPQLITTYEKFSDALKPGLIRKPRVIWVTPPDSSRFSDENERKVDQIIMTNNKKNGYHTFWSKGHTRYIRGETGSDGVHYSRAAGTAWANAFQKQFIIR